MLHALLGAVGALVLLLVLAAGALAVGALRRRTSRLLRRVVVNIEGDRAFNGVLVERHRDILVLRDVSLLEPGQEPISLDGEVVLDRARVAFVQVL